MADHTAVGAMRTPPRSKPGGGGDSADESLASPVVMATPCSIRGTEEVVPATPEEPPMAEAVPTKRVTMQMRHPPKPLHDPDDPGALVLCTAAEAEALSGDGSPGVAVVVDPYIAGKLRPHQREGVRWMYRVLHGLEPDAGPYTGCLLADDMGLGKSLQSIALVWTMLKQGPRGVPTAKRVLLVCPASLVGAWGAEFNKWLGGVRAQAALAEGGGVDAADAYEKWRRGTQPGTESAFDCWPVLVTSYETLRRLSLIAARAEPDLLICDEAHRLRNAQQGSQTLAALRAVDVPRRVLLTGTPIQNNLDEYAAVMDFACPGLLGPVAEFHRRFTAPIQRGSEPNAISADVAEAQRAVNELARLTAGRVLRREASINAAHLPAKTEMVVFCKPTEMQRAMYEQGAKIVQGWSEGKAGASTGSTAAALCAIGLLRQLANSVDQVVKKTSAKSKRGSKGGCDNESPPSKQARIEKEDDNGGLSDGDESDEGEILAGSSTKDADDLHAKLFSSVPSGYSGGVEGSGKLATLRTLLGEMASNSSGDGERMVVVSGFSAALDLAAGLCAELGLTTDRLDGRVPPDARSGLVRNFNAGRGGRVMLLSCVAGGAGLNLVGACRLVLFDTSWNPAHDNQAMARVWRDGQTRPVTIYRLLAAGTVEEKVFQRQLLKLREAAAAGYGGECIGGDGGKTDVGRFTRDELSELVRFSSPAKPATLTAVGWQDSRDAVEDPLLRAAIDDDNSMITAVVRLAEDGGRAKAIAAAKEEIAAAKPKAMKGGKKHRLAFQDLLSKSKNR